MNRTTRYACLVLAATAASLSISDASANDCDYNRGVLDRAIVSGRMTSDAIQRMKAIVAKSCGHTIQTVASGVAAYERALSEAGGADAGKTKPAAEDAEPATQQDSPPDPADSFQPLDPGEDHTGKSCVFFTRPTIERSQLTTVLNRYGEGASVCYGGQMYMCESGHWSKGMHCSSYQDSWKYKAERLEGTQN